MIIAQISDTHISLDVPDSDQRIRDFEATIHDINRLDPQPDAIVHAGDIVQNGLETEYALAASILNNAKRPTYVLAGNKDRRQALYSAFEDQGYLSRQSKFIEYCVDDFSVRLIMLDTVCEGSNKGDFCEDRADSLAKLNSNNDGKPSIVFTHHPPFKTHDCPTPHHFTSADAARRLRQGLRERKHLLALYCGHVHRFNNGSIGSIPALATPSTATSLRWGDYPSRMANKPVYCIHRFDGESGLVSSETRVVG